MEIFIRFLTVVGIVIVLKKPDPNVVPKVSCKLLCSAASNAKYEEYPLIGLCWVREPPIYTCLEISTYLFGF